MSINPITSMYVNIIVAILAAIVSGVISFAGLIPDPISHAIVSWSAFILSIYGVVNATLHSISSTKDGPMSNIKIRLEKIPPEGVGVFLMIICMISLLGLMLGDSTPTRAAVHHSKIIVHHNTLKPVIKPKPNDLKAVGDVIDAPFEPYAFVAAEELTQATPILVTDTEPKAIELEIAAPLPLVEDKPKLTGPIADIWTKLQKVTLQDLQYANNLATNNGDAIASSCFSALITLIQKSQNANLDPTTGQPMVLPVPHLVTDLENVIIIYRELQPTSATSVACSALMNNLKLGSINALLTGLGTGSLASGLLLP